MAARESYYTESLTEQTTTSASAVDALSYTLTPSAGKSYFLIATAEVNVQSTSVKVKANFSNTTDAVTYNNVVAGAGNTSDYFTFAGATKYTDGGSGTAKTFKIQFFSGTAGTTVKIKNCRLCIIEVGANDQYFESTGASTTNATVIDKINSSFTPPSIGDYTLIWVADVNGSTTTTRCQTSVIVGATTYDQNARQARTANTDQYTQCGVIGLASLAASSQTVQMPFNMSSNVSGTIQNAKMIFLRHDGFDDAQFVYQGTAQARTATTYGDVTGGSLTFTPAADQYLFLGGCLQWGGSTSALVGTQLLEDSTTMLETLQAVDTTTERNNFLTAWIETPTNASHTYKYQFKASISSANFQYGTITALKVGTVASGDTVSGQLVEAIDTISSNVTETFTTSGQLTERIDTIGSNAYIANPVSVSGQLVEKADTIGSKVAETFIVSGQLTERIDSIGSTLTFTGTISGRLVEKADIIGCNILLTDVISGQLLEAHDTIGSNVTVGSSGASVSGQLVEHADTIGSNITFTDTLSGQLVEAKDTIGSNILLTDTISGQLAEKSDAIGSTITFTLTASGQLVEARDSIGGKLVVTGGVQTVIAEWLIRARRRGRR